MTDDLIGQVVGEKYRLGSLIARGRDSDLYHARHILTDKPVSVRILPSSIAGDEKARAVFFDVAKAESKIEHPNILNVSDFGTDANGVSYAICDAVTDESLRTQIVRDVQLPVDVALSLGRQITATLITAHATGVVHGNMSSSSILIAEAIDGSPIAKLTGFGSPNAMVRSGDVLEATPLEFAYIPPEQCSGSEFSDERGDVYSVGILLYEMLAGVVPFTGEKPTDVILKHIEEAPAPLVAFRQDIPEGLEPLILKALAKDPALRYQSAQELYDELTALASGESAATAAAVAAPAKQNIWTTIAMVVIGIAALAGALIYATSVKQTDPITALQPDANGVPVQPINPATGIEEQTLAAMPAMTDSASNSSLTPPDTLPGGDGYNPWASGVPLPQPGPEYIPPGGEVYNIPGGGSQFMPNCVMQPSGVLLCYGPPVNANANVKPSPTPRTTPNTNTEPEPTPTPAATPAASPSPTRPAATPRTTPSPARPSGSPAANRPDTDEERIDK
jgi:serine/threonine protein kinase